MAKIIDGFQQACFARGIFARYQVYTTARLKLSISEITKTAAAVPDVARPNRFLLSINAIVGILSVGRP